MSKVGNALFIPQIYQKDLLFERGSSYTVTFDARAEVPRKVNVNIGKELSTDPWFIPYSPTQEFDLTSTMQTFTFTFTINGCKGTVLVLPEAQEPSETSEKVGVFLNPNPISSKFLSYFK